MRYLFSFLAIVALTSCKKPAPVEPSNPSGPSQVVEVELAVATKPLVVLPPPPALDPAGYKLIIDHEVGGGQQYYDKKLSRPTVPPGESGVTIGVGYDLRFNSASVFRSDWRKLNKIDIERLSEACELSHSASLTKVRELRDILVRWQLAEEVFNEVTITRFWQLARRTFPGMDELDTKAQAVLISLTFNRGSSMGVEGRPSWDSRREMRQLRELVKSRDYIAMAKVVRSMKRLWAGKGMDGLLRRREDEARLLESCR